MDTTSLLVPQRELFSNLNDVFSYGEIVPERFLLGFISLL